LKEFNCVETCSRGTRGARFLVENRRVHHTRRQNAWRRWNAEREGLCWQVASRDWPTGFLSHFIFKLNYFIAN
jgi:hypothetical protein